MSLGFYRVIKGKLVVKKRHSPDGDSMRFIAHNMSLFEGLPNYAEPVGDKDLASYQLRFQAIDTPELHYGGVAQPYGLKSRNAYLDWLGVNSREWNWTVAPDGFEWEKEATLLCDGFENHGRPIAFVFHGIAEEDGAEIKLTKELLLESYNFYAVKIGTAYLGVYKGSLSFEIQASLIAAYKKAKSEVEGLWAFDQTRKFKVNTLADISAEQGVLIYPKIFRRCVDALRWVGSEFKPGHDLDDFLKVKPNENDRLVVHASYGNIVNTRLTEVLEQTNNQIRLQLDLNTVEFITK